MQVYQLRKKNKGIENQHRKGENMKILFVVNSNYPYESTGTNLINKLLYEGGLLNKIETIDILAGKESYFDKDFEKIGKMNIYRAWSWTTLPKGEVKKVFKKKPLNAIIGLAIKIYGKFLRILPKHRFSDLLSYKAFYKMLRKIHAERYDIIISISGRYYQSIAASRYSEKRNINYVLYQVDPCETNQSMSKDTLKVRKNVGKYLYENAKLVITTPIIFKEREKENLNNIETKIVPMDFPLVAKVREDINGKEVSDRTVCMFLGSIYGGIRNPEYTIRLFEKLGVQSDVELQMIGVEQEELTADLRTTRVQCKGKLPIEIALAKMYHADFLINIGNSVANQVPSKIFDYISTGKPIINVCKSRECPSLEYLKKYPLCLNLYEEIDIFDEQVELLREFINTQKGKRIDFACLEEIYKNCTPAYCANLMLEKFEEMMRDN